MRLFDDWLSKWRRDKGITDTRALSPAQDLQLGMIVGGDWLLVLGEKLVKTAGKKKPKAAQVREIADGLRALADLLEKAAERYEGATRGLEA